MAERRTHVWMWGAFFLSCLFFFGVFCLDYWHGWTAAERLYLWDYLRSGTRAKVLPAAAGRYTLLQGVDAKGQMRLVAGAGALQGAAVHHGGLPFGVGGAAAIAVVGAAGLSLMRAVGA